MHQDRGPVANFSELRGCNLLDTCSISTHDTMHAEVAFSLWKIAGFAQGVNFTRQFRPSEMTKSKPSFPIFGPLSLPIRWFDVLHTGLT